MAERLLLIDGHSLVYRAFFAMPQMSTKSGEQTAAIYGFTSMLLKAIAETHPTFAIAAFDPAAPTFRHQEFADYKANRVAMPEDLRPQIVRCREVVSALGLPIVEVPGFEADDVIGTLSALAKKRGLETIIVTGDLDALQLVDDDLVKVFATRKGLSETVIYDQKAVEDRYGFPISRLIDYKALRGDSSDNIPGVPGVGEKTATELLKTYSGIDEILGSVDRLAPRVGKSIAENSEQLRLSKRLATIVQDVPVELDLQNSSVGVYDPDAAKRLFEELEFRTLVARLPKAATPSQATLSLDIPATSAVQVKLLTSAEEAASFAQACGQEMSIKTLIDGEAWKGEILGVALANSKGDRSAYAPASDQVTSALKPFLENQDIAKVGYELKRDILAWARNGVKLQGIRFDLLLAAYLANQRQRVTTLSSLARDYGTAELVDEASLLGSGRNKLLFEQVENTELAACVGNQVAVMGQLRDSLLAEMQGEGTVALHDDLELPLTSVLAEMEATGIGVNIAVLSQLSREMSERIGAIESEIQTLANYQFNLGSTQQLAKFLFDDLGLASGKRTKTGRSTDAQTLEGLRDAHPAVNLVMEWRQLTKLKSTYVDTLPVLCDAKQRVHTSFNQAVAATGRLSSSDPNLQNIPIRSEWGQKIRAAFIPEAGCSLISADYSQIELRVLAHLSGDKALIEAFHRGDDIHSLTAARVFGVDIDKVSKEQRRHAKVVNFGIVYGLSDFGLAQGTGMTRDAAREFIDAYFANFPQVDQYLRDSTVTSRERGYAETLWGRKRWIAELRSPNRQLRMAAERMAVNMPIQGTAADIMKKAMLLVDAEIKSSGSPAKLLLQVHDELVLEVPKSDVDNCVQLVRRCMGNAAELQVPLEVEVKVGENWAETIPTSVSEVGEAVDAGVA